MGATHYEALGVPHDASIEVIRRAYRARMRALHPDSNGGAATDTHALAALSAAWRQLSDEARRSAYDKSLFDEQRDDRLSTHRTSAADRSPGSTGPVSAPPSPQSGRSRREAWVYGVRSQIVHLSSRAGRSATQTLLLKGRATSRAEYDELVDDLVRRIAADTEARVRAARAAGAAPLDLGVGATLLGIRAVADQLRRSSAYRKTEVDLMEAELLDRMWDVLAHELPVSLASALGGNPGVSKLLRQAG